MEFTLSLSGRQYASLRTHLLPSDGKEAVALALCGRRDGDIRHRLLVQRIEFVPYDSCKRCDTSVEWTTDSIIHLLDDADRNGLTVVKFHSHPGGYESFSACDDETDALLLPRFAGWIEADVPHASVVMLNDGRMFGRVLTESGALESLHSITVVGDDLDIWFADDFSPDTALPPVPAFTKRHAQAFGERTTRLFGRLRIAVVGCSGTGSIVIEQLMRLGVGVLVLVDSDVTKDLNLNRIMNATSTDALTQRPKVDVAADAIRRADLGTEVIPIYANLYDSNVVRAVAQCDVVFGCVDTHEGRFLLNLIATFYCLPYIDVSVGLEADHSGSISQVCGYVHYLQGDRSSLLSRGVVDILQVQAEGLKRRNPTAYDEQRRVGYIANVEEDRPAVISVNTVLSGMAVNELIARLHRFRHDDNRESAIIGINISENVLYPEQEPALPCKVISKHFGRGDISPLLDLPELSEA
jgi:hypothetical protein